MANSIVPPGTTNVFASVIYESRDVLIKHGKSNPRGVDATAAVAHAKQQPQLRWFTRRRGAAENSKSSDAEWHGMMRPTANQKNHSTNWIEKIQKVFKPSLHFRATPLSLSSLRCPAVPSAAPRLRVKMKSPSRPMRFSCAAVHSIPCSLAALRLCALHLRVKVLPIKSGPTKPSADPLPNSASSTTKPGLTADSASTATAASPDITTPTSRETKTHRTTPSASAFPTAPSSPPDPCQATGKTPPIPSPAN